MKKALSLISSILLVFSILSCTEDEKIVIPAVEIATADVGATTLSFYVAHAGATSGAYLCLPEGNVLPNTAAEVLNNGVNMEMDKQEIVVKGLDIDTPYNIVVAVENEHRSAISNVINMKTSILVPIITAIKEGDVTLTSLAFTVEHKNATQGAYLCIPKGGTIPTEASEVIAQGTPFNTNGGITNVVISDLEPGMEYTLLVAVGNEYAVRMYAPFTITLPAADKPIITITEKEVTNHSFTFTTSVSDAQKAAWLVLPADEKAPNVTTILEDGKALTIDGQEETIVIDELEPGKTYIVYVAAKNYNQEVSQTHEFQIYKGDFMIEFNEATYKTYSQTNRELVLYDGSKENPDYKLTLDFHFNAENTIIPTATYEVKSGTMYGTICTWYSKFEITEETATFELSSGTVKVSSTKKGVYTIEIDIILSDGRNLATTYIGKLIEE